MPPWVEWTAGQPMSVPSNTAIFHDGSAADTVYLLKSGKVLIFSSSIEGHEIGYSIIAPGELFGLAALAGSPIRENVSAIALTKCDLIAIDRSDFQNALHNHPELAPVIITTLVRRLQERTQQLAEVVLSGLSVRLAKWLLQSAIESSTAESGKLASFDYSQKLIGAMLGVSREAVNRKLRQWSNAGIIELDGKLIRIRNRDELQRLARE